MQSIFAKDTSVAVERSESEIKRTLRHYGATQIATFEDSERGLAAVAFCIDHRQVRVELPLPKLEAYATRKVRGRTEKASPEQQRTAWEQGCRTRWRVMALLLKAKLEAIALGVTKLEREFLGDLVLPNGGTIAQRLEQSPEWYAALVDGQAPPMLPAPGRDR